MKTIKQISIFLENQHGKLGDILTALKNENIEIQAASVADTTEFGILRLITSDQTKAARLLSEKGNLSTSMRSWPFRSSPIPALLQTQLTP